MNVLQCDQYLSLLHEFSADSNEPSERFQQISSGDIPDRYRELLAHNRDMTSTLERHWGEPISLQVLASRLEGDYYSRQVVLLTANTKRPIEFGVIRIFLPHLGEIARRDVLAGKMPLGGILNGHGLVYRSCPGGFFQIRSNSLIESALAIKESVWLYGRCNCLSDSEGRTIAEVVEILSPEVNE